MWRWEEEISEDLHSKQSEKIAAGLRDLITRMQDGDEFDLSPFGLEILEPFGQSVPEETQLAFLKIISNYRSFVPPLSSEQFYSTIIGLVLRFAEYSIAFNAALELKVAQNPLEAVNLALQEITHHGLLSEQNIRGAQWLISCLLDGKADMRQATLSNITKWPDEPAYRQVINFILPKLSDQELQLINQTSSN